MTSVRKAVITAAGSGTRQYPATNSIQKELIPLVDTDGHTKPTLQIVLEEALKSGIEELCVIANPTNAGPIRSHFRGLTPDQIARQFRGKEWALALSKKLEDIQSRLTIVIQETQEGYGHAVYQAKDWVGDEPFIHMLGDHIYVSGDDEHGSVVQIVRAFNETQSPVSSVKRTPESQVHRYGTPAGTPVAGTDPLRYLARTIVEKPTVEFARANLRTPGLPDDEYLCLFGIHAMTPDIFDCLGHLVKNDIRQNGEIQFAAAQKMLSEMRPYYLVELTGSQHDMGVPDGLLQTQLALALQSPFRDQVIEFVRSHGK
jgi:UTP--glucose-1-phosphate uridylyltransferase